MKRSLSKRWLIVFSLILLSGPFARAQSSGPGSAVSLDGATGYIQVTNGVWFSGDFTVEGWVFVRSYNSWSHMFDFGNGPRTNNVLLALTTPRLTSIFLLHRSCFPFTSMWSGRRRLCTKVAFD